MDFDWDDANLEHIEDHNVTQEEVEDAVLDTNRLPFNAHRGPNGQPRVGVIGQTASGRYLVVILEQRNSQIRVVTARDADTSEKRRLRRTK